MNQFLNKITKGDCRDLLKQLPDNSIDLVVTDPPYAITDIEWDKVDIDEFTKEWYDLLMPKMKENSSIYIFWSQKYIQKGLDILQINLDEGDRLLIWHHPNLAKPTRKMFLWTYDPVFYKKIGKPHFLAEFFKKENVDVFKYAKPQSNYVKDKGIHPTQKPLELVKNFVSVSSVSGNIVLDPFSGSGTTAVACKQLGIDFVAFEKDDIHYADSIVRFNNS